MKKGFLFKLFVCILVISSVLAGCSPQQGAGNGNGVLDESEGEAPQEKIVLEAISAWHLGSSEHYGYVLFMDTVNERLGDRVEVVYKGGPEAIPTDDQAEILGKGGFDLLETSPSYLITNIPILEAIYASSLTPWEEREKGIHDIFNRELEKNNLVMLGHTGNGEGFAVRLYSNKKVNNISDFKGKTFRVASDGEPFLKALNAGVVLMPAGDIYTAVERGVIDGFQWTTLAVTDFGWEEITKYMIDPTFSALRCTLFINKDTWLGLPEDIRDELMDIVKYVEKESATYFESLVDEEYQKLLESGMELLKLEDADDFLQIYYDVLMNNVRAADAATASELEALLK